MVAGDGLIGIGEGMKKSRLVVSRVDPAAGGAGLRNSRLLRETNVTAQEWLQKRLKKKVALRGSMRTIGFGYGLKKESGVKGNLVSRTSIKSKMKTA